MSKSGRSSGDRLIGVLDALRLLNAGCMAIFWLVALVGLLAFVVWLMVAISQSH